MQKMMLLTLFLAGTCLTAAIAQDTTYFDANWKKIGNADKAAYFMIRNRTDSGWVVKAYYQSRQLEMTGIYMDDSLHIKQGEFVWYDPKGAVFQRCNYVHGKAEGEESYYYPNGHKKVMGMNKDGEKEGEWTGYYTNGKIAGKATYLHGKQVAASFFHEDGSPDKTITSFIKDAEYPGGASQFLNFLNKTFRYPDIAVRKNIQGTVIVLFKVTRDGRPCEFQVVQSVDKSLDAEALRVLHQMSYWEPAVYGGVPSDSYK